MKRTFRVGLHAGDRDGVPLPAADAGHQHEQLADGALASLRQDADSEVRTSAWQGLR